MSLSKRQKRKRVKPPRVKRMKRAGRLQAAKKFLATFQGKNIFKGYCKHFGLDWRCAAIELQQLGVKIDPDYLRQREQTERSTIAKRPRRREKQRLGYEHSEKSFSPTAFDAWLDEDYPLHHTLCERQEASSKDR